MKENTRRKILIAYHWSTIATFMAGWSLGAFFMFYFQQRDYGIEIPTGIWIMLVVCAGLFTFCVHRFVRMFFPIEDAQKEDTFK